MRFFLRNLFCVTLTTPETKGFLDTMDTIVVGADHAGYALKERLAQSLREQGFTVEDVGCYSEASVDYPAISGQLAKKFQEITKKTGHAPRGILCCGSGIGIMIGANRFPWLRAAVVHEHFSAMMSRRHNDTNVICFGARVIAPELALELLQTWLDTPFEGIRHQGRVDMLGDLHLNTVESQAGPGGVPSC